MSSSAAGAAAADEGLGGLIEIGVEGRDGVAGVVEEFGVAQGVGEHRPGALVVGVELVEGVPESLPGVADRAPVVEIGERVGREVVLGARLEQVGLGGEVAVERATLHAGALGDRAQGGAGRPDGAVQFDRRLGDPPVRLGHLRGSLLELVFALRPTFATHYRVTNIARWLGGVYAWLS